MLQILETAQTITSLNEHGEGVASVDADASDSAVVEVPMTVPGDKVVVEVSERDFQLSQRWTTTPTKPKWPLRGKLLMLEAPSAQRATPRCKYFGACGGCRTQHVEYAEQRREKQRRVEELFAPIQADVSPGMEIRTIRGVADAGGSSGAYHYRNKTEFTCSTGRWLLDSDRVDAQDGANEVEEEQDVQSRFPFTVGFFPLALTNARRQRRRSKRSRRRWSPRILSIDQCALQDAACNHLLQALVARCVEAGVEAYDFDSHSGFLKQIVLRRGVNPHANVEIMLGLVTTSMDGPQSDALRHIVGDLSADEELLRGHEDGVNARLVSVVQRMDPEAQRHRQQDAAGEGDRGEDCERVLFGEAYLEDTLLGHRFRISFDSFFQPNSVQASVLYREVQRELALEETPPVIWDLFCGVGSIGICMGPFARKVVGFEIVRAAVDNARVNAQLNGYSESQMEFHYADLTQEWPQELDVVAERPDVVIVDPPRAGLHKKLVKFLRRLAPSKICYISCNPNTQVDDLKRLCQDESEGASYRVRHLQPVDMLPHTPHIETVAWLERVSSE